MGHQLTFTAVEKSGESEIEELPFANSSASIPWSDWETTLGLLDSHPELQEELLALCPDEPEDQEVPSWSTCAAAGALAQTLQRARKLCAFTPLDDVLAYRIVCNRSDGTEPYVVNDQVALVAGNETLILSVAKGVLTRIDRTKQTARTEPLSDGLKIVGSPVGESQVVVARMEATGTNAQPTDVLAQALRVCLVAKAHRGRVRIDLHE
jgi:hypothetical protein